MSEIKQEILNLLILNGRKPQSIKSGERVVYLYDALNIVNKEFSKTDQPQLNENQQIVLKWLKEKLYDSDFKSVMHRFYFNLIHADAYDFYDANGSDWIKAYEKLSNDEFAQVIEVFSRWALEQEEE